MINVTDNAKKEAIKLMAADDMGDSAFIRVGVKAGGSSGLMNELEFDTKIKDGDKEFEDN